MKYKIEIREGEIIPKGYGVAIRRLETDTAVLYPIPLNILVALVNRIYLWLRYKHKLYDNGYVRGYNKGCEDGRKYAFNQYREQVKIQEIKNIVSNFMDYEEKMIDKHRKGENINGWIYTFIEKETKRIEL